MRCGFREFKSEECRFQDRKCEWWLVKKSSFQLAAFSWPIQTTNIAVLHKTFCLFYLKTLKEQ